MPAVAIAAAIAEAAASAAAAVAAQSGGWAAEAVAAAAVGGRASVSLDLPQRCERLALAALLGPSALDEGGEDAVQGLQILPTRCQLVKNVAQIARHDRPFVGVAEEVGGIELPFEMGEQRQ